LESIQEAPNYTAIHLLATMTSTTTASSGQPGRDKDDAQHLPNNMSSTTNLAYLVVEEVIGQSSNDQDHRHDHGLPDQEEDDDDEATVALNAADVSFLETLQRQEDDQEDDDKSERENETDAELRYNRPIWGHVLDLNDDERVRDDGHDYNHESLGEAVERRLLIGPLLPAAGATLSNNEEIVEPSLLLGRSTEQVPDRTTLQDLEELAALTQDIDTPLEGTNEPSLDPLAALLPNKKAPSDVFTGSRTPPRKRKFNMTDRDPAENIMMDSFHPPAQRIRQSPPVTHLTKTQQASHALNATGLPSDRECHRGIAFQDFALSKAQRQQQGEERTSSNDDFEQNLQQPNHSRQQPISLARTRWNFVTAEQCRALKALQTARGEFERARTNLEEAEKQCQSVQEVVAGTCRDCYSFLIQEDKPWYECYQMLEDYYAKHGNTLVPRNTQAIKKETQMNNGANMRNGTGGGNDVTNFPNLSKLGRWVGTQRSLYKKQELEGFKVYALKRLHFDFDPVESKWQEQYQFLVTFAKENGHAKVPYNYTVKREEAGNKGESGHARDASKTVPLGTWVKRQQHQYKRFQEGKQSEMTPERIRLLNKIGMVWSRREELFEDRMKELRDYKATHGHIDVKPEVNATLFAFVRDQRSKYNEYKKSPRESTLTKKQAHLLEETGIADTDKRENTWKERFEDLKKFCGSHGHCDVPSHYPEKQQLASWCKRQRQNYRLGLLGLENPLSDERIAQLKSVGFDFELSPKQRKLTAPAHPETLLKALSTPLIQRKNNCSWEQCFSELLAHRIHTKSFRIPKGARGLEHFVEEQRDEYAKYVTGKPSTLTYERIMKLKRIKFPFHLKARTGQREKGDLQKSWEEMLSDLMQFFLIHDSFTVPPEQRNLHEWVQRQHELYQQHVDTKPKSVPSDILLRFNK
jgi:hypothetical protein